MKRTGAASVAVLVASSLTPSAYADGESSPTKEYRKWLQDEYQWRFIATAAPPSETDVHEQYSNQLTMYLDKVRTLSGPTTDDILDINQLSVTGDAPPKTYVQVSLKTSSHAWGDADFWNSYDDDYDMGTTPSPEVTVKLTKTGDSTAEYLDGTAAPSMTDPTIARDTPAQESECQVKDDVQEFDIGVVTDGIVVHSGTWANFGWTWRHELYEAAEDEVNVLFEMGSGGWKLVVKENSGSHTVLNPLKSVTKPMTWAFAVIQRKRTKLLRKEWKWTHETSWHTVPDSELTPEELAQKNPAWPASWTDGGQ